MEDGKGAADQDTGPVPCKPLLCQAGLPVASSGEPSLTPRHLEPHCASWTSSPGRARSPRIVSMGPGPASCSLPEPSVCGSLLFCQTLCVSERCAGDGAGEPQLLPQRVSGQQKPYPLCLTGRSRIQQGPSLTTCLLYWVPRHFGTMG